MKLIAVLVNPSKPRSKFFAIADLVVWGLVMAQSGLGLTHGLFFGGKPEWWYWIQWPLFLFQFWMFKRSLDGYYWFKDSRDE
jgi:hypothetical protein